MRHLGMRCESLTGLRFLAALAVLLKHGAFVLAPAKLWVTLFMLGYVGVSFFFMLSGFVLAWSYDRHLSLEAFYGRRISRIYPLHLLTALAAVSLLALAAVSTPPGAVLANILLLQAWFPQETYASALNGVSWSLSCEAFFYALFPFLVRPLMQASRPLRIALLVVLATMLGCIAMHMLLPAQIAEHVVYKNPLLRVGEFVLGMLLAANLRRFVRFNDIRVGLACFLASLLCVFLVSRLISKTLVPVGHDFVNLMMLPATAFLIASAANSDLAGRRSLFRSRTMVLLGQASFALYMVHALVLQAAALLLGKGYGVWMLASAASILLSILVFKLVEEPMEAWLRARIGMPRRPQRAGMKAAGGSG